MRTKPTSYDFINFLYERLLDFSPERLREFFVKNRDCHVLLGIGLFVLLYPATYEFFTPSLGKIINILLRSSIVCFIIFGIAFFIEKGQKIIRKTNKPDIVDAAYTAYASIPGALLYKAILIAGFVEFAWLIGLGFIAFAILLRIVKN